MGIDMKVSLALLALSLALCCFAVDETFEECEGSVDSGLDFVAGTYFTTNVAGSYSYSLDVSENPSLTYNFVLQYNDNNACGGDFSTVPETPSPTGPTAPPTGPTSPTSPTSPPACAS